MAHGILLSGFRTPPRFNAVRYSGTVSSWRSFVLVESDAAFDRPPRHSFDGVVGVSPPRPLTKLVDLLVFHRSSVRVVGSTPSVDVGTPPKLLSHLFGNTLCGGKVFGTELLFMPLALVARRTHPPTHDDVRSLDVLHKPRPSGSGVVHLPLRLHGGVLALMAVCAAPLLPCDLACHQ